MHALLPPTGPSGWGPGPEGVADRNERWRAAASGQTTSPVDHCTQTELDGGRAGVLLDRGCYLSSCEVGALLFRALICDHAC